MKMYGEKNPNWKGGVTKNMKEYHREWRKKNPDKAKEASKRHRMKDPNYGLGIRGERNGMWRGDNVGYASLHLWVYRNKQKPSKCEVCNEQKRLEASNISGEYKRDLDDWEWICRKCHLTKDGRLEKLKKTQFKKGHKNELRKNVGYKNKESK